MSDAVLELVKLAPATLTAAAIMGLLYVIVQAARFGWSLFGQRWAKIESAVAQVGNIEASVLRVDNLVQSIITRNAQLEAEVRGLSTSVGKCVLIEENARTIGGVWDVVRKTEREFGEYVASQRAREEERERYDQKLKDLTSKRRRS